MKRIRAWTLLLAAASVLTGCSLDIFDVVVELDARVLSADFGKQTGTVPAVPCTAAEPDTCGGAATTLAFDGASLGVPGEITLAAACDEAKSSCYAVAAARPSVPVNALTDDDFATRLARNVTFLLRSVAVTYTVPVNTLTFEVPPIRIYAGPEGSKRESDPDVLLVATTRPIPAGKTVSQEQTVSIPDDSEGLSFITDSVEDRRTFVLLAVIAPRVDAGSPVPSGYIEINLLPHLLVGLPR